MNLKAASITHRSDEENKLRKLDYLQELLIYKT